jgi:hypothetical protein
MRKTPTALFIFAATMLFAGTAYAFQAGDSCDLKRTSDGFVALRDGGSIHARLLHKLRPSFHRVFPTEPNPTWVYVSVASPESWDVPTSQQWSGEGYIRSSLIKWNSCSNAG